MASLADVDKAVAAARSAYHGEWATWTAQQRTDVMNRFADLLDKHTAKLAVLEAKSMGQPVMNAHFLYGLASNCFRYMAGWTNKVPGEQWPEENGVYKVSLVFPFLFPGFVDAVLMQV